jgi:hypothetical protein
VTVRRAGVITCLQCKTMYIPVSNHESLRATISAGMQVPRREFWNNGEPERLPDAWRMTRSKATTR